MFKLNQKLFMLLASTLFASTHSTAFTPEQSSLHSAASRELPEMILAAVARGDSGIRIPPGRYYVRPEKGTHLRLENIKDFSIDATDVEMVCSETTRAIFIRGGENLTIRGLTIDYDPLPFTQGRIIDISENRKSHIIEIEQGYPPGESAIVFKHLIYTPERELRYGNYHQMQIETLPDNHLRISGLHPRKDGGEQIGDTVVISSESFTGRFDPHAVHLYASDNSLLEGVTIYASPTFGFFEEHCNGTKYIGCVVDRREGRLHSLNADAFHSKFSKIGPRLENCRAMWMGDDGINICGAYHLILESKGTTLHVLAKRNLDIKVGDPVQLMAPDGGLMHPANVVSIRRSGPRTDKDQNILAKLDLLPGVRELLQDAYRIELDRPVDLKAGSVIGSLNRMGNGFAIIDSEFGNIRSRGILVKASDGVIMGNTVVNCHLEGIKISPEYNWLESGTSRNVRVEGNRIIGSKGTSVLIDNIESSIIHENIEIIGNTIHSDSYPLIRIRGLDGGRLYRNALGNAAGNRAPASAVAIQFSEDIRR